MLENHSILERMAGHDSTGKKSSDTINDLPTFNTENLQSNMKTIFYSRTFMAIIAGVVAGILGLTSWKGFVVYFLVMAITSVGLIAKAGFSIHSYFDSWNQIVLDGFFGGLLSFVLFWTFAYDIVHIF
ncbi:hypothetical protein F8388_012878 [Cannabis sativa]|uniref:ER membrane protein complex subunit 6 n=3 Tax=Cannabis sativa TaxID=3483 RepID=A0A7J6ESP1_CANSA|nr:hypothetical protein G4B88_000291 [Cannabis sativa]KAF4361418.1 hypothetical protein F8388_012878 [Cannabis sativa]